MAAYFGYQLRGSTFKGSFCRIRFKSEFKNIIFFRVRPTLICAGRNGNGNFKMFLLFFNAVRFPENLLAQNAGLKKQRFGHFLSI
jgi:hypothetical protein